MLLQIIIDKYAWLSMSKRVLYNNMQYTLTFSKHYIYVSVTHKQHHKVNSAFEMKIL